MKNKVMNKKGFSISELLMVVLILSLIIVILGGGLTVVINSYNRITLRAEAQTLLSTSITELTDEFRFAGDIGTDDNGHTTFISPTYGCEVYPDNGGSEKGIVLKNTITTGTSADDVATLVTDKTMTSGLYTEIDNYSFDGNTFVATVTVKNSSDNEVISQEIVVRPVNQ